MRDFRILMVQARYAITGTLRSPRIIFFAIIFPIVLLVLFNSIFAGGSDKNTQFAGGTISTAAYFTAGLAAYAIMLQTFSSLAVSLTTQRESGELKRLRGTPMPSWTFIGGYILRSIILVVVMVVVLFAIGVGVYNVHLTGAGIVGIAVYVVLGTFSLATLGIAITTVTPTAEVASTVGPFTAVILSFISGVFIPVATLPDWLEAVGRVFPLYHLAEGMQRSVASVGGSTGLTGTNLAVLAGWGIAGLLVAARSFRWQPQGVTA